MVPSLSPESQLLIVGCGNSSMSQLKIPFFNYLALSEELYSEGYKNQVNIDFADIVIKSMQEKYKDRAGMICMLYRSLSNQYLSRQTHGHAINGLPG